MGELEIITAALGVFKEYGGSSILAFLGYLVWKNQAVLGNKSGAYVRLYLKQRAAMLSKEDILNHKYFDSLDALMSGFTFTTVTQGGSNTDFKMYVADVTSYVNHWLYRKHLVSYIKAGKYDNLVTDIPAILAEFSKDTEIAVAKALNPEIAGVYKRATEMVRGVYFDAIQAVMGSDKLKTNEKVYVLLDLLNYRIGNSHTLLYKIFLEMNGKIESQADLVTPINKEELIVILKTLKQ